MKTTNMIKNNIYFIAILLLLTFNFNTCDEYKDNNNVECKENNISNFIQLQLSCDKDTVSYGDSIVFKLIFKNKTDSTIKFYTKSLMLLKQDIELLLPINETSSIIFSDTIDVSKYADLKSRESYISHYKVVIYNENLIFYKKGIHNIYILFFYSKPFLSKWKNSKIYKENFKYCGYLKSNNIKLFVK